MPSTISHPHFSSAKKPRPSNNSNSPSSRINPLFAHRSLQNPAPRAARDTYILCDRAIITPRRGQNGARVCVCVYFREPPPAAGSAARSLGRSKASKHCGGWGDRGWLSYYCGRRRASFDLAPKVSLTRTKGGREASECPRNTMITF